MTPVILTGGIDLSVGSLLGLCAVLFGKLWRDAGLDPAAAAGCTLVLGALAGGLNAALIAGLRLPPLIVTLGTYSLFRGLAEAITRGADTFTNFPAAFLFLGQDRWLGLPTQAWFRYIRHFRLIRNFWFFWFIWYKRNFRYFRCRNFRYLRLIRYIRCRYFWYKWHFRTIRNLRYLR
jgi:predicted ABC-type sugar transport system permease subunit